MLDPATAIAAVGATSAIGATACGVKAVIEHRRLQLTSALTRSVRRIWDDVVGEPVPEEIMEVARSLDRREVQ
jgi:hypothetical protein